jgi:uncharacterized membrane protein
VILLVPILEVSDWKCRTTHIACRIVCEVQSTISLLNQVVYDGFALWQVLRVDKVG